VNTVLSEFIGHFSRLEEIQKDIQKEGKKDKQRERERETRGKKFLNFPRSQFINHSA